jgi:hypothetical protein
MQVEVSQSKDIVKSTFKSLLSATGDCRFLTCHLASCALPRSRQTAARALWARLSALCTGAAWALWTRVSALCTGAAWALWTLRDRPSRLLCHCMILLGAQIERLS